MSLKSDRASTSRRLRSAITAAIEPLECRRLFAVTTFDIDPTRSFVSLDARALGESLDSQSSGSLRAAYEGSIQVDLDSDTIEFISEGTDIIAQSKGNFDPGSGPANYAGEAEGPFGIDLGEAAVRGLRLTVDSAPISLTSTGEESFRFTSGGQNISVTDGILEYDILGSDGTRELDGNSVDNDGAAATIVTADGVTTLTLPVKITYSYSSIARLRLSGKIVATSTGTASVVDANGPSEGGRDFQARLNTQADTSLAIVDPTLIVRDDGDTIASAAITITNLRDGANESLAVSTAGTSITSNYDSNTGVLTLSGVDTKANYQAVLRTLTYANVDSDPTTGNRDMTVVLDDGDEVGLTTNLIVEVWDPNVVVLGDGGPTSIKYTEADGSVSTLSIKGGGAATVTFNGAADQTIRGRTATITGSTVTLNDISVVNGTDEGVEVDGSAAKTTVTISTTKGDKLTSFDDLTAVDGLKALSAKTANVTGNVNVTGALTSVSIKSLTGGSVTTETIKTLSVASDVTNSTITITGNPLPLFAPSLRTFTVKGQIVNSTIDSNGTIGTLKAYALLGSNIYAGRNGSDSFPNDQADLDSAVAIRSLSLVTPRQPTAQTFSDSVIAASQIGTLRLGVVDTDNGGDAFGVTADLIASIRATDLLGERLSATRLNDPTLAASELAEDGFTFGDLEIRVV